MANERIYIVEDERIIAIDLQRRLERLGYVVCGSASDAEEALAGIRSTKPDLILMDIVLPGAVDGIDVAVQVRRELNVPVIFLSAYTDARTLERAKAANPLGYILKPFKERELATMLEMALFKSVADERIREKEQLFAAILNSTTDAILVTGLDTEIRFLNPEAEQILEISDAEARDQRLTDLATFSDMESGEPVVIPRLADGMQPVKARGVRLTNRKQNSFVVEMSITREDSDPRKQPNVIVSFKDITGPAQAAERQRQFQGYTGPARGHRLAEVPDEPRYPDGPAQPQRARPQAQRDARFAGEPRGEGEPHLRRYRPLQGRQRFVRHPGGGPLD